MIIGDTWALKMTGGSRSSPELRAASILWRNHRGDGSWGSFMEMEMAAPLKAIPATARRARKNKGLLRLIS
jgi:hypothetical protein